MAYDVTAVQLRDEGDDEVFVGTEAIDQIGLGRAPEGGCQYRAHRTRIAFLLRSHRDREIRRGGHANRAPAAIGVPRRNSSAFIACRPARCNSRMRTAPSPQATVSLSSSTVPGGPSPSALVVRSTFTRMSPPISNQAPGAGDKPRIWLCTSRQGRAQLIRVSSLAIL